VVKKIITILGVTSLLTLSACTNSESPDSSEDTNQSTQTNENVSQGNLIDKDSVAKGQWINFEGQETVSSSYVTTDNITYDLNVTYELSGGSYVSYYNGEEFLETVLQNEPGPIESVDNADSIKLSFNETFLDTLKLESN